MTQKLDKKKKRKLLDNIVTISSAIQQVFMNLLNRVFKLKNSNRTIKTLFFAQKRKGGSKVKRFFLSGGGIKIHLGLNVYCKCSDVRRSNRASKSSPRFQKRVLTDRVPALSRSGRVIAIKWSACT